MKKIKVVVRKKFLDRYTGTFRNVGEKLTVTEARFAEIKRSGDYVEVEKASAPAPVKNDKVEKPTNEIKK